MVQKTKQKNNGTTVKLIKREIKKSDFSFGEITKQTGISKAWLSRFASGEIKDPGLSKIEKLVEFFGIEVTL